MKNCELLSKNLLSANLIKAFIKYVRSSLIRVIEKKERT